MTDLVASREPRLPPPADGPPGFHLLAKPSGSTCDVDFNILCTVNAANQEHGRAVYRFFRDELGAKWVQFIPIIERATEQTISIANKGSSEQAGKKRLLYTQAGNLVTERTVGAEQYSRFLVDVFEEWVRHDVSRVYVLALLLALVSGAVIMNSAIMGLPSEKDGRFWPFVTGGLAYALPLLPLS